MNKVFLWFLQYSGVNALARLFLNNKIYILNYHSVFSKVNAEQLQVGLYSNLSIDAELFEKHVKLLVKNGHTFLKMRELLELDISKLRRSTIIYFDDGYKDNIINALPILKKYNIKGTVCVAPGLIDRSHVLWTIKHRAFLLEQNVDVQEREKIILTLKTVSKSKRETLLRTMYKNARFLWRPEDQNIFLNWDDLRTLRDEGWEIASHSVSHSDLTELTPEGIVAELVESKRKIEEELKIKVVSFSCPYGRWDPAVNKALKVAGYKIIVSIGAGLNDNKTFNNLPVYLKTVPVKITDTTYKLGSKLYSRYFLRS